MVEHFSHGNGITVHLLCDHLMQIKLWQWILALRSRWNFALLWLAKHERIKNTFQWFLSRDDYYHSFIHFSLFPSFYVYSLLYISIL